MFQDSTVTGHWSEDEVFHARSPVVQRVLRSASLWFPGMDHRDVSALADQLAQCTCQHLPWSDQRVIAIELGVGDCDLAIDDMVRGAVHGPVRCRSTSSRGYTNGWMAMTPPPAPTRLNCAAM